MIIPCDTDLLVEKLAGAALEDMTSNELESLVLASKKLKSLANRELFRRRKSIKRKTSLPSISEISGAQFDEN